MKRLLPVVTVVFIFFTNSLIAQQLFTNTNIQNAYKNQHGFRRVSLERIIGKTAVIIKSM